MRGSTRVICWLAAFFCLAASVHATTITVSDGVSQTLVASQIFRVDVNPGGNLTAATAWQGTASFSANYSFSLSGYALPAGSTIDNATLDLSALTVILNPVITAQNPVLRQNGQNVGVFNTSYTPNFGNNGAGTYTTVTAGAFTANVNLGSASLDLLALGFGGELLAGTPITINWQQSLNLTASTANWVHIPQQWNNSYRDYTYTVSRDTTPWGLLTIDYTGATGVPEPATFGLIALGGALMLVLKRRAQ